MTETALTADRILDAAEECLRRYGPLKTTVVDVARALNVTHGAIYRHYPSKEALREAVIGRWLLSEQASLAAVAGQALPPVARLKAWLQHLIEIKRQKVLADPELFATHCDLVKDTRNFREIIQAHVDVLVSQVAGIIADGVAAGIFRNDDASRLARAVLCTTVVFHHPMHVQMQAEGGAGIHVAEFDDVMYLILNGLGFQPPAGAHAET